jgi:hypothetical protein
MIWKEQKSFIMEYYLIETTDENGVKGVGGGMGKREDEAEATG